MPTARTTAVPALEEHACGEDRQSADGIAVDRNPVADRRGVGGQDRGAVGMVGAEAPRRRTVDRVGSDGRLAHPMILAPPDGSGRPCSAGPRESVYCAGVDLFAGTAGSTSDTESIR